MGKEKERISWSEIDCAKCLYRHYRQYIKRDIRIESPAMRFGGCGHSIVRNYTELCTKAKVEADYDLMMKALDETFPKYKLPDEDYQEMTRIMLDFGEMSLDFDHVLNFEQWFELSIGKDRYEKEMMVCGKIDRTNARLNQDNTTTLEIIDYKFQHNVMTEQDVRDSMQLKIYRYICAYLMYKNYTYVRTGIYHMRYNFIRWDGPPTYVGDLLNEFESIKKYLEKQWYRIMYDTEHKPERGPWCWRYGGCDVMLLGECPLWDMETVNKMRQTDELEESIRLLRKLDLEKKIILGEIKAGWLEGQVLEVDGDNVGYFQKEYINYPLLDFYGWAIRNGVPLNTVTISERETKYCINRYKSQSGHNLNIESEAELETMKKKNVRNNFQY